MRIIIWTQAKRLFYIFAEALKQKLLDINYDVITIYKSVNLKKFKLLNDDILIIIGAQFIMIEKDLIDMIKNNKLIIYSTEPLTCEERKKTMISSLEKLCKLDYIIWEYSLHNIEIFKENYKYKKVYFIPFGYYPYYENLIPKNKKKIDVLFYGDITNRRLKLLKKLETNKIRVYYSNKLYDPKKRDNIISKSRLVLDIFRFDNFECNNLYRLSYLISNKVLVVAENSNNQIYNKLRDYIIFEDYDNINKKVVDILLNYDKYLEKINLAYDKFKKDFNIENYKLKDIIDNFQR